MTHNILFLGDVHSSYGHVTRAIEKHQSELVQKGQKLDMVIQVGDFGHNYLHARMNPKGFGVPFLFIDGNHDNIPWLQKLEAPYQVADNTYFVPRATHRDGINFLGGARSIDRKYGREGFHWFAEEIPSDAEFEVFKALPPADVWVTHTPPKDVVERLLGFRDDYDPVGMALQHIYERSRHKPKFWFCGHLHTAASFVYQGTTQMFVLDCVFPREDRDGNLIPPHYGWVHTVE